LTDWKSLPRPNEFKLESSSSNRFYMDFKPTGENNSFVSINQALAGPPNSKIYDPVPLVPPIAANDYWGEKHVVPTSINTTAPFDLYSSGYIPMRKNSTIERYTQNVETPYSNVSKPTWKDQPPKMGIPSWKPGVTEGDIIEWSYNPEQLSYNIPSNVPSGKCNMTSEMKDYNDSIYTDIIQPNLYQRNEIVESTQSNMGISFQQQRPPYSRATDSSGNTIYTALDPRQVSYEPNPPYNENKQVNANTYDPRSYGYGTSYRSYVHPITGQVRFMYDDIDAVRKPNYIGRSNIDHHTWAQGYGTIQDSIDLHDSIRLAEEQYKRDNLQFREELQVQYGTSKKGRWQRKGAPMHTMSMGMNSCRR
jgi:hypothetical protein